MGIKSKTIAVFFTLLRNSSIIGSGEAVIGEGSISCPNSSTCSDRTTLTSSQSPISSTGKSLKLLSTSRTSCPGCADLCTLLSAANAKRPIPRAPKVAVCSERASNKIFVPTGAEIPVTEIGAVSRSRVRSAALLRPSSSFIPSVRDSSTASESNGPESSIRCAETTCSAVSASSPQAGRGTSGLNSGFTHAVTGSGTVPRNAGSVWTARAGLTIRRWRLRTVQLRSGTGSFVVTPSAVAFVLRKTLSIGSAIRCPRDC